MNAHAGYALLVILLAVLSLFFAVGPSMAHAATLSVITAADTGAGSLRQAIIDANTGVGPDTITFDTGKPGKCTFFINLTSQLPVLTDDGTTIDGTECNVTIDGSALPNATDEGLRVRASDSVILGLTIQNFPEDGMRIQPNGGGTGPAVTGVVINGNTFTGNLDALRVSGGVGPSNIVEAIIEENTLTQNRDDGMFVIGSNGNLTDGGNDVTVRIRNNTIIGSLGVVTAGLRTGDGIRVLGGAGSSGRGPNGGNTVHAFISGNTVRDNADDGILVAGSGTGAASNHIVHAEITGNDIDNTGAPEATLANGVVIRGGSTAPLDNLFGGKNNNISFLISNNTIDQSKDAGIFVPAGLGILNDVSGTISENKLERNGSSGINVNGAGGSFNTIHNISILNNVVERNGDHGLLVFGGNGSNNTLSGINVDGNTFKLNEAHGIALIKAGINNIISLIGITNNRTSQNKRDGIFVQLGVPGSGATPISGNEVIANREDGIDLNDIGYVVSDNEVRGNTGAGIDAVGNTDGGGNIAVGNGSCNAPGCF